MKHPHSVPLVALALVCALGAPAAARAADPILTVATSGGGAVSGPGIACPPDCAEPYPIGTIRVCEHTPEMLPGQCGWVEEPHPQSITLAAQTPPGWQFSGWGGECSGTGACKVTLDDDRAVSATWAPIAAPPDTGPAPPATGGAGEGDAAPAGGGITVTDLPPAAGHGSTTVRAVRAARTIPFTLDYSYQRNARATWFTKLSLRGLPRRTRVRVGCRGGGCPPRGAGLRRLVGRRLRPGARIAVRITHPGLIGRLVRLTVARDRRPAVSGRCLTPGGGQARACGR